MPLRPRSWPLLLAAAVACAPTVTKDPTVTTSAATLALFAPDSAEPCNSVLPFPSDLAKDPATGKLNIPYCQTDTADQTGMKTGLRTLDGYAAGTSLYTRFSGPIDATSAAAAVKVFAADSGAEIDVVTSFDAATNTLYVQPLAPLAEKSRYLVAVTTDLLDEAGKAVAPDQVFVFAKSEEPLVDEYKYSRYSVLSDADANALEALRLSFKPVFDGLAAKGLTRDKLAVAWAFTTQTVHASLPALGQAVSSGAQFTWENKVRANAHALVAAAGIPADKLCEIHTGRVALKSLLTGAGTFGADAAGLPLVSTEVADYLLITPNPDPAGNPGCATPPAWAADRIVVFAHGLGRCKNDALALANTLAAAGWATLSVDGPFAGARAQLALGDADLDGCADQPATPEFIAPPGSTSTNPFVVRDHLREWALELSQLVSAAHAAPWTLVGGAAGAAPAKVAVVGHSWGGMAAALGSGLLADASALAVSASSAELGAVFTPAIEQTMAAQLEAAGVDVATEAGRALLAAKTRESVAAFRWAMEPGDPLYGATPSSTPPVLVQVAAGAAGQEEAPLHGAATQKKLAAAFQVPAEVQARTTFDLTASGAALCDDGPAIVGALLQPCVADEAAATYPLAAARTGGMQRQVATFVTTAAAGAPLVCDPDFTKPCP